MEVGTVGCGKLPPAPRAVGGDVNPAAAERQTGAANLLAEIPLARACIHDVGMGWIDEQRVDRDVRQAIARGAPGSAVVVTSPDASRDTGSEKRRRNRRMKSHDARAA